MTSRPPDAVLEAALRCAGAGQSAVLVTIAAVKGSTPRLPGTRMLVDPIGIVGSVGGGQLEFEIIAHACALMAQNARASTQQHFILGPDLGQCCGGALDIVLEPVMPQSADWLTQVMAWDEASLPWQSSLELGQPSHARQVCLAEDASMAPGAHLDKSLPMVRLVEMSGPRWPMVYLFGAGHVGRALVRLLGDLPYHIVWSDERTDMFPPQIPATVVIGPGDAMPDMIKAAPADAHFLVMTHSHALDFEIVQAVLQRGSFASLGLIGSGTKRARFVQRLGEAGIGQENLARLQCPIGLAGIRSKVPAAIAIAVVAELLLRSEKIDSGREEIAAGVQLRA